MKLTPTTAAACLIAVAICSSAHARVWTDVTGKYTVDASLIAFNERHVVLERSDHQLVSVPFDQLSEADHEYLKSKEALQAVSDTIGATQTWTMRDGMQVVGKIVDYVRQDLTIQRRRGKIYVNDRPYDNLPQIYQIMVPKIVAELDKLNQPDKDGLEAWCVRQQGQPRTFPLEGVLMEFQNGDEYAIPFFFFSEKDQRILKPGWDEWLANHQDYYRHEDSAFRLQSLAAAYLRDQQIQRQIAMTQLNLQAVQVGLTSVWEVMLYPPDGNAGSPFSVVMYGRDSRQAAEAALAQHPGYVVGPIRKVGGW